MEGMSKLLRWPKRRDRVRLNSNKLKWAAYDAASETLYVWPARGRKITHKFISQGVFNNLITADPPDFYYHFYIARERKRRSRLPGPFVLLCLAILVGVMICLALRG